MSMARWTILMINLVLALTVGQAWAADQVTYVSKEKVAAAAAKGGPLTDGSNYKVSVSRRDKPGQAEVHDHETDVFYIMDGSATFVTGGAVEGGKTTSPGQTLGSGIKGGKSQELSKGDVIVIPKGTPHWFKDVHGVVVYYVVKVL